MRLDSVPGPRGTSHDSFPSWPSTAPDGSLGDWRPCWPAVGERVSDLEVLHDSPELFGSAPPNATVSWFVERASEAPGTVEDGFTTLMRSMRSRIWAAAGRRNPATQATRLDALPLAIDATLVTTYSTENGGG